MVEKLKVLKSLLTYPTLREPLQGTERAMRYLSAPQTPNNLLTFNL